MTKDTIGIDVSKATLDVFWQSRQTARALPNSEAGFAQLCDWLGTHKKLAKTDTVDARMLARMGHVLDLSPQVTETEDVHDLRELLTARRALVKDQVTAKTRLATAINPLIRDQLHRRIDDIATDIEAVDEVIAQIAKTRGALEDRMRRLMTIPGIGRLTATTMLIDMPELGHLDSKKIAALAGLAPMTQRSGKWQGKECIVGGRASLRRAIYMPAWSRSASMMICALCIFIFSKQEKQRRLRSRPSCVASLFLQTHCSVKNEIGSPKALDQDGYSTAHSANDCVHPGSPK